MQHEVKSKPLWSMKSVYNLLIYKSYHTEQTVANLAGKPAKELPMENRDFSRDIHGALRFMVFRTEEAKGPSLDTRLHVVTASVLSTPYDTDETLSRTWTRSPRTWPSMTTSSSDVVVPSCPVEPTTGAGRTRKTRENTLPGKPGYSINSINCTTTGRKIRFNLIHLCYYRANSLSI